jgi:nitrogen permease regulator 3-like protein
MSTTFLPPNPSLVAIILIIKTRQGVKHAYHYPPNPGEDRPYTKLDNDQSSNEGDSSEASYSSVEDEMVDEAGNEGRRNINDDTNIDESGSASPEKNAAWNGPTRSHKELLRLPTGFASFLCPPPTYHKKRFEMTIDQLTFLGWPCFARENGEWKRKPRTMREHKRRMSTISEQMPSKSTLSKLSTQIDEELGETTGQESVDEAQEVEQSSGSNREEKVEPSEEEIHRDSSNQQMPSLSMFHVVFVMNPPPLEHHVRVDEMYNNVVKKFSRALKWEQTRSNYVLRECEKLKSLKAKHGT